MINLHTHTVRCGHARGTDREYIEAAIAAGYKEIGFSDHSFLNLQQYPAGIFRPDEENAKDYVQSIRALREEYKDRITIHLGMEMEYVAKCYDEMLAYYKDLGIEYFILGQHIAYTDEGGYTYAGMPSESLKSMDRYIDDCLEAMSRGVFTYLAHPDLFKYMGDRNVYRERMAAFIEKLVAENVQLEYNRLGFYEHRNYPDPVFWELVSEAHADVCVALDAHSPDVYSDTDTVKRMHESLEELGLQHRDPTIIRL